MIIVNIILLFIPIILTIAKNEIKRNNKIKQEIESAMQREIAFARKFNSFSIPDYLSRRERTILDLMEQREKEEPYIITLWLGLDGLQLNEDGSTEWISRRKADEKEEETPADLTLQDVIDSQIQEVLSRISKIGYKDTKDTEELLALYRMRRNLQIMNAAQEQNRYANLQSMIQTQCQNSALPAYPTYVSPFMTQNTPYWTYSAGYGGGAGGTHGGGGGAGGRCGTYRY